MPSSTIGFLLCTSTPAKPTPCSANILSPRRVGVIKKRFVHVWEVYFPRSKPLIILLYSIFDRKGNPLEFTKPLVIFHFVNSQHFYIPLA